MSLLDGGTWELLSDAILYPKQPCPIPFADGRTVELHGHSRNCNSLAFNGSGTLLASGADDKSARLWSVDTVSSVSKLEPHGDGVVQVCWEPHSDTTLATLAADKCLRFWDSRQKHATAQLKVSHEYINLAWTDNGECVAVGSSVGAKDDSGVKDSVSLVDVRTTRVIRKLKFTYEVNEFCWAPTSRHLFLTTEHGTVELLEALEDAAMSDDDPPPKTAQAYTMYAHTDDCYCIDIKPEHNRLAVGSKDSIVSIWDLEYLASIRTVARHVTPVRCVALSSQAKFIASSAYEPGIDIADTNSGDLVHKIDAQAAMNSLAWHPTNLTLAYALDAKSAASTPSNPQLSSVPTPPGRASPHTLSSSDDFIKLFSVTDDQIARATSQTSKTAPAAVSEAAD